MPARHRLPYVWDYDLDEAQFLDLLEGRRAFGRLDQDWAARRLLEYAPYADIVRLTGFPKLVRNWPRWRGASVPRAANGGLTFSSSGCLKSIPNTAVSNAAFYFNVFYPYRATPPNTAPPQSPPYTLAPPRRWLA